MEYKGYIAKTEFDDDTKLFHGEVTNLHDVITFQGKTVEELRTAFHDSVDDYLEFCEEQNEPPEKPSTWIQQLTPPKKAIHQSDKELREDYYDYLKKKHQ